MMRMKLMLLGKETALGKALIRNAGQKGISFIQPEEPVLGWSPDDLDALVETERPGLIINLSGYFDWFQAADVSREQLTAHEQVVKSLVEVCRKQDRILFQPSNYRVFGGARAMAYEEKDEPLPLSLQGQSLWRVEQGVRNAEIRYILLRFGWLIDDSEDGRLDRFMKRAERGKELSLADDRRGNPTLVDDAARVIVAMLQQLDCNAELWGTYHYAAQEATTTLAFGQALLVEGKTCAPLTGQIVPRPHAACPDVSVEPQHGVLSSKKILNTFGIKTLAWRAGLPSLVQCYFEQRKAS